MDDLKSVKTSKNNINRKEKKYKMIFKPLILTINRDKTSLDEPVYLYKGDGGICLCVKIRQAKYKFGNHLARTEILDLDYAHSCEVYVLGANKQLRLVPKAEITENEVHIFIDKEWLNESSEVGKHYVQIVLYDESGESRVTLPPFNFEVLSPIEGEGSGESELLTENGIALLSEEGNGIRISELPSTRIGRGYVPVVQDNVTYKYDIGLLSERIDNLENYPVEIPTDIQEELAKLTGATIDYNGNEFETIKEAMDSNVKWLIQYVDEKIAEVGGSGANLISTFNQTIFGLDEEVVIPYELITETYGQGTLYVTIKDNKGVEEISTYPTFKGENTVELGAFAKGSYTITMYAIDFRGSQSNPLIFKINVGGLEVSSTFIYNKDYVVTDNIIIPFNVESVFTGEMLYHIEIGGFSYSGNALNGYNSFTVPSECKTSGVKRVRLWIEQNGNISKILAFNLIILDSNGILISSETQEIKLEYGYKFTLDYRISTRVVNNVDTIYYVDDEEISSQNVPVGVNSWLIEKVAEGTHTIKIKAFSGDMVALLEIPLIITESDYTPVQHVSSGLTVYFDATVRTNGDSDKETWTSLVADESGEYATANLYGYNYSTNGWVDGALVSPNGTHVEIHHKPLKDNILHGFTFDILYKSRLLDSEDNRVVECTEGDREIGFKITSNKAYLTGDSNNISNEYLDDEYTHITFIVDRYSTYYIDGVEQENPMCQIYVNGILSSASILTDNGEGADRQYESFLSTSNIFLNASSDGSLNGETSFKKIRVYNRALTHEEVLQNYIADIEDLAVQREVYEQNYTLLDQMLPVLYMNDSEIGTHANMTKDNKQYMYIRYSSPDEKKFGESFEYLGRTAWQGTSSLVYPVKNYKFTLYEYSHDEDDNLVVGDKVKVNPYIEGHAEDTFCLKADYMESSHSRNTGTARFINDVLYRGTPSPSKQQDSKTRDTINGFPCLLYVNNQRMGVFNFNHDKSCKKALGFSTIEDFYRFEISANSETTTGAFNKTWQDGDGTDIIYEHLLSDYEVAFDEDRAEETGLEFDVTEYYDELLIPHDEEVVMGTYNDRALLSLARFIKFVSDSTDEEYKARLHEYCDVDRAIRYWINVQMFGMIDNYAKNTFLNCFDGKIFYFAFYDMDSSIGLDNTGYLINTPDIEMMDKKSTGAYVFNCATSRMWSKLFNNFKDEIEEIYTELRNGAFTLESLTKYIVTDQIDRIPARMYNEDQYTKYISQGRQYLHMLHGSNREHIINWLSYRIHYLDSLIMGIKSPYTSKSITIRSNNPNADGGGYTATLNILPIRTQYITVKWRNGEFETQRAIGGQVATYTFDMVNATDNEVIIYCAYNLRDIGSLTNMNPSTIDIGEATNLTQLIAPNCKSLLKADVSKNVKLNKIDLNGCTSLGSELGGAGANILDIKNCVNLKYVDVRNTCINSVITNSIGSTIEKLYLSDKTTNISLINFTNLTDLYIGDGSNLMSFNVKGVPFDLSTYIDIILRATQITIDSSNVGTDLDISNTYNKATTIKLSNLTVNTLRYTHNTSIDKPMTTENYPTVQDFGFKLNYLEIGYMPNLTTLILGKNTENNDSNALGFDNNNAMVFLHDLPQLATINTYVGYVGLNKLILNNELKNFNFKHVATNHQNGDFGMFNYEYSEDVVLPLITLNTILSQSAYHEDNNRTNIVNLKNSDCFISQLNWKSCSLFKYYDNVKKICICPYDIANNRPRNAYDYKIDSTAINTGIYFYSDSLDYPNVDYPLYVHDIDFTNAPLSTSLMTGSHRYLYDNVFTDMSQFDDVKSKMGMVDNTVEFIHDNTFNCGFTLTNENCDNYMPSTSEKPVTINGDVTIENTVLSAIGSFKHTIINGNVIINSVDNVNLTETFYGATINGNVTINCTGEVNLSNAFQNATITGEIVFTSDCLVNAYYMLHGATLDKAPLMPLGTYNIQYAFANSTITKTPNNWSLPYINSEVLKDRTKTYAYQGCSNITSIGTVENWQVVDWVDGSIDNIYTTWGGGTVPPYEKHEYTIELFEDGTTINLETNQIMATEYNEDVDWGDGTVDNESSHTYATAGTYTIKTNKFIGLTDIKQGQFVKSVKLSTDNIISYHDTETEQGILGKCPNLTYLDFGAVKINPTYVLNSTIAMLMVLTIDIDCSNLNEMPLFAKDRRFATVTVNVKQVNNTFTLGKFREHGTAIVGNLTYDLTSINHEYDLYISEPFVCTGYCNIKLNDYAKVKSLYKLVTPHQSTATKSILIEGGDFTQLTSLNNTFNGLDTTNVSIENLDMSIITDMSYAFANAKAILDVEEWDMNGVTTVSHMFSGCGRITSLDLSKWDTSTITDMSYLFNNCYTLITLDLSNWNTAHVTNMSHMFANCYYLSPLDLYYFDTTSLTTYDNMLMGVYGEVSITSRFTLTEEDVNFDGKFIILLIGVFLRYTANASGLEPYIIKVENDAPYVKQETDNGDGTFTVQYANADEYTLTQISFYNKSGLLSVEDMRGNLTNAKSSSTSSIIRPMFYGCKNLTSVNLQGITTTNMTSMYQMFYNCSSLTSLDVSHFNTENVTNMGSMFYNCSKVPTIDVSNFNTEKVTSMSSMFSNCSSVTELDVSNFNTSLVTIMGEMFYNCSKVTTLDVSDFNTEKVTNMSRMFYGCSSVTVLDVSGFNTENVTGTGMQQMFYNCSKVTTLDVSNFNTSLIANMYGMFSGCSKLTSLDLSNFDTSSVTDMSWMFNGCSSLESLNTSTWDTSKVTTMMYMFSFGYSSTIKLKTLDLSNFTVGSTTDVRMMFSSYMTQIYYDSSKFHETPLATVMSACPNTTFTDVNATANTQAIMELQDDSTMTMMALTELYETTQSQQPMVMSLEEEEPVQTFAMRTTATTVSPFVEAIIPSIYARLIKRGYKTIDDVPYSIREQVETLL